MKNTINDVLEWDLLNQPIRVPSEIPTYLAFYFDKVFKKNEEEKIDSEMVNKAIMISYLNFSNRIKIN